MFEFLKDGYEAIGQRIRSPFLGSIALVFLATNWKPIVYLLYADKTIKAKFLYFDANTSSLTLYIIPIVFGVILALIAPWLKLIGAKWAKYPSKKLKVLQGDEARAHRIYEYKQSAAEETALAKLEAAKERRLIDASKRLGEAREAGADTETDLEASRSEGRNIIDKYDLTEIQKLVIETLGRIASGAKINQIIGLNDYKAKAGEIITNLNVKRLEVETKDACEILRGKKLINLSSFDNTFSLTASGYNVYDNLVTD